MLGLRHKISLGFGALLVIILVIGAQSIHQLSRLGLSIDVILRENYRSVLACQQMKEAIERIDSGYLFVLLGHTDQGRTLINDNRVAFDKSLQAELQNITLPAEGPMAAGLQDLYRQYGAILDRALASQPSAAMSQAYFGDLLPLFYQIKGQADAILQLNQNNMSEAN